LKVHKFDSKLFFGTEIGFNNFPVIKSYHLTREMIKDLEVYLRIRAFMVDNGQMDIFIYVTSNHEITLEKYSFHWQDKDKKLVMRWDNAPHHLELENFPHHLHLEEETRPSAEPYFMVCT